MGSIGSLEYLPKGGRLPAGCWDTHVHVFDSTMGPFAPGVAYTPAQAPLSDLLAFHQSLAEGGLPINLVLVQPSPYGTDNSVLVKSLQQVNIGGKSHARGIAVVDLASTTDDELWALHHAGVRGIRLNKMSSGHAFDSQALIDDIKLAAGRIKDLPGWKLQLFVSGSTWDDIYETVLSLPVVVIADHVGGMLGLSRLPPDVQKATWQPGYQSLVKLARQGRVIVKISGLYRLSSDTGTGHADLEPVIRGLAAEAPDRLVYASDWPHTGDGAARVAKKAGQVEQFRIVDNKLVLRNLRDWVGEGGWDRMMTLTPAFLFE